MVIPIIIPVPVSYPSFSAPTPVQRSRGAIRDFFLGLVSDVAYFATPKKSAEHTAQAMFKRAKRQLRADVKHDNRSGRENPTWRYGGNFSDRWIHAVTRYNFDVRNKAFELFRPMMEAHIIQHYGVAVEANVRIISEEYASWVVYNWEVSVPQAQPSPKRRRFFFWR